jgi:hypothetical protein
MKPLISEGNQGLVEEIAVLPAIIEQGRDWFAIDRIVVTINPAHREAVETGEPIATAKIIAFE